MWHYFKSGIALEHSLTISFYFILMKYKSSLLNFVAYNRIVNSHTSKLPGLFIQKLGDSSPSSLHLSIY